MARFCKARLAVAAAILWLVAGLGYLSLEAIAAAAFHPGYSYTHNLISDLGVIVASPRALAMNAAFCLQGILFVVAAVLATWAAGKPGSVLFASFAAANALGNILVSAFHSGPAGTAPLHHIGAALAIIGGNAAILAGSSVLANAGLPRWYRAASVALAVLGFVSLLALFVGSRGAAANGAPAGLWERGSVYSILAWQMLTATCLLRVGWATTQRW
jgi:hypothetical membrane protein